MSLEAIEKVTQVENEVRERRAAAEAEAKQIIADAEKEGQALLQRTRSAGVDAGRELLRQAEERAAAAAAKTAQAAETAKAAEADAAALRDAAGKRLEAAAEFIVGRVVKH